MNAICYNERLKTKGLCDARGTVAVCSTWQTERLKRNAMCTKCAHGIHLKCLPDLIDAVVKLGLGRIVLSTLGARPATTPGFPDAPRKMLWLVECYAISTKHFCCDSHGGNAAVCAGNAHSNGGRNDQVCALVCIPLVDAVAHPPLLFLQEILQGQCLETIR